VAGAMPSTGDRRVLRRGHELGLRNVRPQGFRDRVAGPSASSLVPAADRGVPGTYQPGLSLLVRGAAPGVGAQKRLRSAGARGFPKDTGHSTSGRSRVRTGDLLDDPAARPATASRLPSQCACNTQPTRNASPSSGANSNSAPPGDVALLRQRAERQHRLKATTLPSVHEELSVLPRIGALTCRSSSVWSGSYAGRPSTVSTTSALSSHESSSSGSARPRHAARLNADLLNDPDADMDVGAPQVRGAGLHGRDVAVLDE
jgi:hypothetical protein